MSGLYMKYNTGFKWVKDSPFCLITSELKKKWNHIILTSHKKLTEVQISTMRILFTDLKQHQVCLTISLIFLSDSISDPYKFYKYQKCIFIFHDDKNSPISPYMLNHIKVILKCLRSPSSFIKTVWWFSLYIFSSFLHRYLTRKYR